MDTKPPENDDVWNDSAADALQKIAGECRKFKHKQDALWSSLSFTGTKGTRSLSPQRLSSESSNAPKTNASPVSSVKDTRSAVATFRRWLRTTFPDEAREIHHIPVTEMDNYLSIFYLTVKKRSGDEYDISSLRALRARLDLYLKANHYPCSITSFPTFAASLEAYKQKLKLLQLAKKKGGEP